jgi:hypothetical protein
VDQDEWRVARHHEHGQPGRRRVARLEDGLRRREGLWLCLDLSTRLLQAGDRQALLPERLYVSAQVLGHQAALL